MPYKCGIIEVLRYQNNKIVYRAGASRIIMEAVNE